MVLVHNYEKMKQMDVPEFPTWRQEEDRYPSTSKMLSEIVKMKSCLQSNESTKEYDEKLRDSKLNYIHRNNVGEGEGNQSLESLETALNAEQKENVTREEQVSINQLAANEHLEECNLGSDRGLLDIEECIQDTHEILMKNLLEPSKPGKFSDRHRYTNDGHYYPKFCSKECAESCLRIKIDIYNEAIDKTKKFRNGTH